MSDVSVRLRLLVAYDGTDFSGWAAQPGLRTVQGVLEGVLAQVLRHRDQLPLTVAGRTDAGVHARGQVCHVDVPRQLLAEITLDRLRHRLARALPADIRVAEVTEAAAGFDARFSASWRRYAYRLCDDRATVDPLLRGHVLAHPREVDVDAMNAASASLLGEHDFAAFCKKREGATTIRTLQELTWVRAGSLVTGRVLADAFCHHMVRSLVGCLLVIGEGRRPVTWADEVLAAGVRDPRVPVVAAHGLVLEEVGYPSDDELADRAAETRRVRSLAR